MIRTLDATSDREARAGRLLIRAVNIMAESRAVVSVHRHISALPPEIAEGLDRLDDACSEFIIDAVMVGIEILGDKEVTAIKNAFEKFIK